MKRTLLTLAVTSLLVTTAFADPIHDAARDGDLAGVQAELDKGADVNAKDEEGWTPLHFAAARDHKEIAELLIVNGAEVNAKDVYDKTPLDYANDWFTGHNTQTNWTADEFINRAAHAMLRASLVSQSATDPATGNTATGYFIGGKVVNPDIGIAGFQHPLFPVPQNQGVFNPANGVSSGIQLFPANAYTPEVHRLLQVAANIYDATTNQLDYPNPPTVMRPVFRKYANPGGGTGVFISRYTEVTNDLQRLRRQSFMDLTNVVLRPQFQFDTDLHINIHGVPWIVGAKKGLPNFNEYSVESIVQVSRRLEVNKGILANVPPAMSLNWRTNQMYSLGITNVFGIEGWNSYTNAYPRRLGMDIRHQYQIGLWDHSVTNKSGTALPRLLTNLVSRPYWKFTTLNNNQWLGREFKVPLNAAATTITNSIYSTGLKRFFPANRASTNVFETGFAVPDWKLHITNRVQYFLVDLDLNRVVDAVNLDNLVTSMDITQLTTGQTGAASSLFGSGNLSEGAFWETNRVNASQGNRSPTFGVMNQIQVARGQKPVSAAFWRSYNNDPYTGRNKEKAIQDFDDFLRGQNRPRRPSDMIRKQAPFTPVRKIYKRASWQANDPLVHYTVNDLTDPVITDRFSTNNVVYLRPPNSPLPGNNLGLINERYRPWGGGGQLADVNAYNFYAKDPLITASDAWQFPTNKFPSIGWLGRVHRGTSWQTMYLKSGGASLTNWWAWSGSFGTHNLIKADEKPIKALLRKHGGKYGTIHTAAGSGDVEAVREFLDAGVDVDAKGESGETPLLHATFNSHKEIAELLVAEGADVNKKLWNGKTLLHQFIDARLPTGFFPLGIVEWLINNGADVNAEYGHGVTPLFLAVQAWREEVVQLLIDNGADLNIISRFALWGVEDATPLGWAIEEDFDEIADLLRKHGGKTAAELNALMPRLVQHGRFAFSFDAKEGRVYEVQDSFDLLNWEVIKTYTGTGTAVRFDEERDHDPPKWFYRVRVGE
jgi:ankyrin repeat protein